MKFRPAASTASTGAPQPLLSSNTMNKEKSLVFKPRFARPLATKSVTTERSISPSPKRHKPNDETLDKPDETLDLPIVIEYPKDVAVPSKACIKAIYECAIEDPDSHQNQLNDNGTGLLSLEDVLIPAVVQEEMNALKLVQAKAQRDAPEQAKLLQECRCALYDSGERAIQQAREARMERQEKKARQDAMDEEKRRVTREQRQLEKEKARQERRKERAASRAAEKERRKRELKKRHPKNVELWKEVAELQAELANLTMEERLWKESEEQLKDRESELVVREQEEAQSEDDESHVAAEADNTKHELEVKVDHAVEDITLSSLRIQQSLRSVADLMEKSVNAGKELYDKYNKDHVFYGYRGVRAPKALIRAMVTN